MNKTNAQKQLAFEAQEAQEELRYYPSASGLAEFFIRHGVDGYELTGIANGILIRLQPRKTAGSAFAKFCDLADYQE